MALRWMTAFWDLPGEHFDAGVDFWLKVTRSTLSDRRGRNAEFATLLPPDGDAYLAVQHLESGAGGNHLDLHVDYIGAETARAVAAGAAEVSDQAGFSVLRSPGGFEFCLVGHHGDTRRPQPFQAPTGQRSIVDQVCIDIPPDVYEDETAFWSSLTGWPIGPSARPEFRRLDVPAGMPLRILLQRLKTAVPGQATRAHMDLACSDVEAETARHVDLGAEPTFRTAHWQTLRDPAGIEYCITTRDPDSGRLM